MKFKNAITKLIILMGRTLDDLEVTGSLDERTLELIIASLGV